MKRSQRPGAAAYFTDEQLDRAIAQAELRLRRFPDANMTRKMLEKMTTERWRRARAGRLAHDARDYEHLTSRTKTRGQW